MIGAVESVLQLALGCSSMTLACLWLVQERFITAKYVEKRYAMTAVPATLGTPQTALWEACEGRSIRYGVQHNICLYIYICMYLCIYIYMCDSTDLYIYIYIYISLYILLFICIYTHNYMYIYIYSACFARTPGAMR